MDIACACLCFLLLENQCSCRMEKKIGEEQEQKPGADSWGAPGTEAGGKVAAARMPKVEGFQDLKWGWNGRI